jgi:hypothetical protein
MRNLLRMLPVVKMKIFCGNNWNNKNNNNINYNNSNNKNNNYYNYKKLKNNKCNNNLMQLIIIIEYSMN